MFRGDVQRNDVALSPVSRAFVKAKNLAHPYVMPSLNNVLDFVAFYQAYYSLGGAGVSEPNAKQRALNAKNVRFNIETKRNPRTDKDSMGLVYAERTLSAEQLVSVLADTIIARNYFSRITIQSFDFASLLYAQENYPNLRTVYLFGDFPTEAGFDGTNLQNQKGINLWMGGLVWPYRQTRESHPQWVQSSGGFEGMALSPDGEFLYPMLEKPLSNASARQLKVAQFSLSKQHYTGVTHFYPMDERGTAIGDFILVSETQGIVIERDGSQADLQGFKRLFKVTLGADGQVMEKAELVDLLAIADPKRLARGEEGDIGVNTERFAFPFVTIESVLVEDADTLLIINDNNYPFSVGRHVGDIENTSDDRPDDSEFILLQLPEDSLTY